MYFNEGDPEDGKTLTTAIYSTTVTSSPPWASAAPVSRKRRLLGHLYASDFETAERWTWTCTCCGKAVTTLEWLNKPIQDQFALLFPCPVRMVATRLLADKELPKETVLVCAPVHGVLSPETLRRLYPNRELP